MITKTSLGTSQRLFNKVLYRLAQEAGLDPQWEPLFNKFGSTQLYERFKTLTGFGPLQERDSDGNTAVDRIYPLYDRQMQPITFGLRYRVSQEAKYTDQYDVVGGLPAKAMTAARITKAVKASNIFNNATDSSYTGGDGVTLSNTAHPTNGFASYSNQETAAAFSYTAVKTMRQNMRKVRDARNQTMRNAGPAFLFVPPDLQFEAESFMNSTLLPDTNWNNANMVKNGLTLLLMDNLSSTTQFGLVNTDKSKHTLSFVQQMPLKSYMDIPIEQHLEVLVNESYIFDWIDGYGHQHNAGA